MSPSIRVRSAVARLGRIERDAARAQAKLIATLRREILAELASASSFRRWQLQGVLDAVDRFVAEGSRAAGASAVSYARQAAGVGTEIVAAGGGAAAATGGLAGVSHALLDAILNHVRREVHDVWRELGAKLVGTIRRVTLGVDDPFKAMQKLARTLMSPKTFPSKFARAEAIVRTEVNRTFSIATNASARAADDAAKAIGGHYVKWWLSAEDERVRPDHVRAAEDYTEDKAIPLDEPFMVGGEPMRYPLDPQASAGQTVNCRCVQLQKEVLT